MKKTKLPFGVKMKVEVEKTEFIDNDKTKAGEKKDEKDKTD